MQDARDGLDRSHRRNHTALDNLMSPLQKYVEQGDLASQLALKTEECNNLHITLKHQRDENLALQRALNVYKQKEVVAAASAIPPPRGFARLTVPTTGQCEIMFPLLQIFLSLPPQLRVKR